MALGRTDGGGEGRLINDVISGPQIGAVPGSRLRWIAGVSRDRERSVGGTGSADMSPSVTETVAVRTPAGC